MLALLFGICLGTVGCGDSGGTTNVGENADSKAIADYEAAMAADQQANDAGNKGVPEAK